MRNAELPLPPIRPSLCLAALALLLAAASFGCGAGELGGVPVARFTVDVYEIDIENDCDPASNPDGGDFRLEVMIRDTTGGGGKRMGRFDRALVAQSKVPAALPLDVVVEGETREEAGRRVRVDVDLMEDDGNGVLDARTLRSYPFTWSAGEKCWSYDDDPSICLAPGDEVELFHALDDSTAPICHAGVAFGIAYEPVRRTPAEAHAGSWYGDEIQIHMTPVDGGDDYSCLFAELGLSGPTGADGLFEGGGGCLRGDVPAGLSWEYTAQMRFVSDTEVEGALFFDSDAGQLEVPFAGTRTLDELEISISTVTPAPRTGVGIGDLHWTGGAVLEQ